MKQQAALKFSTFDHKTLKINSLNLEGVESSHNTNHEKTHCFGSGMTEVLLCTGTEVHCFVT
jgi:hypothetical protein